MTDFTKANIRKEGRRGWAIGLSATVVVFGIASVIVFGAVAAAIGIVAPVMTLAQWLMIFATVGATAWVGYHAQKEINEREQAMSLDQRTDTRAGGKAAGLLDSGDGDVRAKAAYILAGAAEQGGGGVVKQADTSAEQIVAELAGLLDDERQNARANGAAGLASFAYDYPGEVRRHEDALIEAVRRPETEVQTRALGALRAILTSPKADSDVAEKYLTPLSEAAKDDDHRVRVSAANALSVIGGRQSTAILKNLLNDSRAEVRQRANEALSHRQGQQSGSSNSEGAAGSTEDTSTGADSLDDDLIRSPPDMDFDDVAGMEDLKMKLRERVIDPFSGEGAYADFGVGSESGVLLHGPPGTGKTHMAKCLAGELDINYLEGGVGDVESQWLGEGVENITNIFDQARRNQPVLIFLDEFDALAPERSSRDQHSNEKKQVNALLQEFSDLGDDDDILVVAATNNADAIDDAMLRTGRLDSKIKVPKPDGEARVGIFHHHLSAPIVSDTDLDIDTEVKQRTTGCTGSDMERIANQAARSAAKRQSGTAGAGDRPLGIEWRDIEQAIESVAKESGGVGQYVERPPDMSFDDAAGMEDLKATLREKIINPLDDPEIYEQFGVGIEHGFLFYGPPGAGKTHMAKCLAGEMDVSFINAKAGDLVSKWIGQPAKNVQAMFSEARENQPCLVFIDEIDGLAGRRNSGGQQKSERQMVNQFLEEVGSISDNDDDVIVIGATNTPNDVDEALLRSGRLGEKIEVGRPDAEARVAIFKQHLDAPSEDLDYDRIAEMTGGLVSSDMERVAENAARGALKQTQTSGEFRPVSQHDVEDAIERV